MMDVGKLDLFRGEGQPLSAFQGRGHIRSLRLSPVYFRLDTNDREGQGDKSPTHLIKAVGDHADGFEIGAAWVREIQRGKMAGYVMVSLVFDDPDLPEWSHNLSAFPDPRGGSHRITHERKRGGQPPARADGPPPAAGDDNDPIPF